MEIRFGSSDLATLCNCSAAIDRRWGQHVGAAIRERLCLLAGTPTLDLLREFVGAMKEPVTLDQQGGFDIAVVSNFTFRVLPDHKPIPFLRGRELDCKKVRKLLIVEVNGHEC
jgi:hypothetical protein